MAAIDVFNLAMGYLNAGQIANLLPLIHDDAVLVHLNGHGIEGSSANKKGAAKYLQKVGGGAGDRGMQLNVTQITPSTNGRAVYGQATWQDNTHPATQIAFFFSVDDTGTQLLQLVGRIDS